MISRLQERLASSAVLHRVSTLHSTLEGRPDTYGASENIAHGLSELPYLLAFSPSRPCKRDEVLPSPGWEACPPASCQYMLALGQLYPGLLHGRACIGSSTGARVSYGIRKVGSWLAFKAERSILIGRQVRILPSLQGAPQAWELTLALP